MMKYSELTPCWDSYDRCCDEQRYSCTDEDCGGRFCIFCESGCPECGQLIDFGA